MHEDRLVQSSDLVLLQDIAKRLGVNPTKITNMASARRNLTGFPCPVSGQGSRGIWLWSEVEQWWHDQYVRPAPNVKPRVTRQRHNAA